MANLAWAAEVKEENFQAILSEAANSFDLDFLKAWSESNGEGYFIRDKSSPLDCLLFPKNEFHLLYCFHYKDDGNLFRLVDRKN